MDNNFLDIEDWVRRFPDIKIFIFFGERENGKTTSGLNLITKRFIEKKYLAAIIFYNEPQLDEFKDGCTNFEIIRKNKFKIKKKYLLSADDERIAYLGAITLSGHVRLAGLRNLNIKTIFFDEFLDEFKKPTLTDGERLSSILISIWGRLKYNNPDNLLIFTSNYNHTDHPIFTAFGRFPDFSEKNYDIVESALYVKLNWSPNRNVQPKIYNLGNYSSQAYSDTKLVFSNSIISDTDSNFLFNIKINNYLFTLKLKGEKLILCDLDTNEKSKPINLKNSFDEAEKVNFEILRNLLISYFEKKLYFSNWKNEAIFQKEIVKDPKLATIRKDLI